MKRQGDAYSLVRLAWIQPEKALENTLSLYEPIAFIRTLRPPPRSQRAKRDYAQEASVVWAED